MVLLSFEEIFILDASSEAATFAGGDSRISNSDGHRAGCSMLLTRLRVSSSLPRIHVSRMDTIKMMASVRSKPKMRSYRAGCKCGQAKVNGHADRRKQCGNQTTNPLPTIRVSNSSAKPKIFTATVANATVNANGITAANVPLIVRNLYRPRNNIANELKLLDQLFCSLFAAVYRQVRAGRGKKRIPKAKNPICALGARCCS